MNEMIETISEITAISLGSEGSRFMTLELFCTGYGDGTCIAVSGRAEFSAPFESESHTRGADVACARGGESEGFACLQFSEGCEEGLGGGFVEVLFHCLNIYL